MNRKGLISKAKKLIHRESSLRAAPKVPWINYFGTNQPPVGYEGMVLNYTIWEDEEKTHRPTDDVNSD